MTFTPGLLDWLLVPALTCTIIVDHCLFAALRRQPTAERSTAARLRYYAFVMAYQWALVVGVLALWIGRGRPWSALLLGVPSGWPFAAALLVAAFYFPFAARQSRALQERPEAMKRLRHRLGSLEDLLPHTPRERTVFRYLAVTAGISEEILFRGFLLTIIAHVTGLVIAVPVAALLFGLSHAYQGRTGILKTGLVGLVLTFIVLGSGSLLPGIVLHIGLDLSSGDVGYELLSPTPKKVLENPS
jgi:membrane protease YdiL (CAAX protease family)